MVACTTVLLTARSLVRTSSDTIPIVPINVIAHGTILNTTKSHASFFPSLPVSLRRTFSMQVTVGGEAVQHCTPAPSAASAAVLGREYDGMSVYSPPADCSLTFPTLTVVHGDLHAASCTAEEDIGDTGLSAAIVGVPSTFRVVARDAFGNIRHVSPSVR